MTFLLRLLLTTTLAAFAVQSAAATLTSSVDRTTLSANETLQLTVIYQGDTPSSEPDFAVLDSNFERISAPSRQQNYSWINGKSESSLTWTISLHPKSSGTLTIPAFQVDGASSRPISVNVRPAATKPGEQNPVFLDVEADKDSLYVQEQLLLTYRLYHEVPLANIKPGWGDIANSEVLQLGHSEYRATLDGRNYEVVEWKFAVFPSASGTLDIPAFRINAYSPSSIRFRNGRRFSQFSKPLSLAVKPQPANSGRHWLPARKVELKEQAIDPNKEWRVGEPLTRKITLTGMGTTSALLPEIPLPASSDFRSYPDQPQLEQAAGSDTVVASRTESVALVPNQPGIVTLPAVELQWWNTQSQQLETARLPERTLQVLPAETTAYTPTAVQPQIAPAAPVEQQSGWLLKLSVATNIALAIIAVVLLLQLRRRKSLPTAENKPEEKQQLGDEKELFTIVRRHAKAGDIKQTREAILQWAQCYWPNQSAITLDKLGQLSGDPELPKQLVALDQSLYGAVKTEVDLQWIATQLKRFRAHGGTANSGKEKNGLQPLYPG
ncbi:BatD family protein [Porticoccus sp. W117]|uniref:BatD family protein n=1 Tax=Porticoccus sp. W117 TaxID=3054777 RepID=UPI002595FF65|nr:BatD family protein [Porticoccus sp. W117]MDM3871087.1 BatD family protein [Porticoccus sp. W117]